AASLLLFYVFGRYRVPLVPLLVLFAAGGIDRLPAYLRGSSVAQRSGLALLTILMVIVSNWPLIARGMPRAVSETNLGIALAERGRNAEAEAYFTSAVAANANFPQAHINLAKQLKARGRTAEAVAAYERAIAAAPAYADAHLYLGLELQSDGEHARAI